MKIERVPAPIPQGQVLEIVSGTMDRLRAKYPLMSDDFLRWQSCHDVGKLLGMNALEVNKILAEIGRNHNERKDVFRMANGMVIERVDSFPAQMHGRGVSQNEQLYLEIEALGREAKYEGQASLRVLCENKKDIKRFRGVGGRMSPHCTSGCKRAFTDKRYRVSTLSKVEGNDTYVYIQVAYDREGK